MKPIHWAALLGAVLVVGVGAAVVMRKSDSEHAQVQLAEQRKIEEAQRAEAKRQADLAAAQAIAKRQEEQGVVNNIVGGLSGLLKGAGSVAADPNTAKGVSAGIAGIGGLLGSFASSSKGSGVD